MWNKYQGLLNSPAHYIRHRCLILSLPQHNQRVKWKSLRRQQLGCAASACAARALPVVLTKDFPVIWHMMNWNDF